MTHYVNLHQHTDHSLLDGYSTVEDYAKRAKELGMTHLTTTDHGTLTNSRNTMKVAKENGLIPIIGMEAYYTNDISDRRKAKDREPENPVYFHLTMIAQNENGLKNLQTINNIAWSQSHFYTKPRLDMELLNEYRDDIIVSSACLGGVLCKAFEREDDKAAYDHANQMREIFGDNYYIEVMSPNGAKMNGKLLKLADKLKIKPIVTDDCHHAWPEDLVANDAMLIMQTKENNRVHPQADLTKAQKMGVMERFNYLYPDRFMTFRDLDVHLKDGNTHLENFAKQGIHRTDIVDNTREIADSIGEYPLHQGLDLLPRPVGVDPDKALTSLAYAGLQKRGKATPEYKERLQHELDVIISKNFSTYFLLTKDILDEVRKRGILAGYGRGSGAGSLVNYALYITHADPIQYGLLFSRFLDPSRSDYPDIDNDVPDTERESIRQHIVDKFVNVGNIMTFSGADGKSLFNDVCRVLKIPFADSEPVTKLIHDWDDFKESKDPKVVGFKIKHGYVEPLGDKIRGRIRQRGIHASGLILSKEPIANYATIESAANPKDSSGDRIPVVGLDMHEAESLGFIKMDLLGLKALGIVDDIVKMVRKRHNHDIDIHKLNFADDAVFKSIRKGNTAGIFQIEGSAFTKILNTMPMENFNDIVAGTSLVRPGAGDSRFGEQFLEFRNKGKVHKVHPDIDPFLAETGGAVLYQEQLMQMCVHLGGMTDEESNEVRRAVGKKNAEKLALWSERFIEGVAQKIGEKDAKALWKDVEASAKYSFNKSHAVTYSMLTYAMAFLKHYYPLEFYTALLAREKSGEKKVEYLIEAKRNGIRVLTPHVNRSDVAMSIQGDAQGDHLRMGLSDIKGIGKVAGRKILQARPFMNYAHLTEVSETKGSGISVGVLKALNAVGGARFDDNPLTGNEQDNFYEYLDIPNFAVEKMTPMVQNRITPMDEFSEKGIYIVMAMVTKITKKDNWARADLMDDSGQGSAFFSPNMNLEKGDFKIFLVADNSVISCINPDEIDGNMPLAKYLSTEMMRGFDGYRVLGFSSRKTKAGDDMGTLVVTDDNHEMKSLVVFSSKYHMTVTHAKPGAVVRIKTKATRDGGEMLDYITTGQ